MSMREHLKAMHTAHADFHVRAAKSHEALGKCFSKMDVEGAEDVAAAHQELAKTHADAAADSVQCCKKLDASNKAAMGDDDRIEPMPQGLSVINKSSNVQAVPRFGAPNIAADRANVPLEFAHLVTVNEED